MKPRSSFSGWLRHNSEHYLLADAQRQLAEKYGRPMPPLAGSLKDRFWLGVFAPTYRRLPWKLRRFTIQAMPGSHRQAWTKPPLRGTPAVSIDGYAQSPTSLPET